MKKLSKQEFIKRSNVIHNNKYDYSLVDYTNSNTEIVIICPDHGEFLQKPNSHLNGRGCKDCCYKYRPKKINLEFKNIIIDLLNKNYDLAKLAKESINIFNFKVCKETLRKFCKENNIVVSSKIVVCEFCKQKMINEDVIKNHSCQPMKIQQAMEPLKHELKEMIENKGYSIYELWSKSSKLFGIEFKSESLYTFCNRNNIIINETLRKKRTKEKIDETIFDKFGVKNVSQSQLIKNKKEKHFIDTYGVINPFQLDSVKEKSKKTMLEKYGVECAVHIPGRKNNNGRISHPHKKVSDYLNLMGIEHDNEKAGLFRKYNKILDRIYSPVVDIFIKDGIVIEIYGDHWHCNPKIYKSSDIIETWDGIITANERWLFDEERVKQIESFGVKVIILWSSDIRKNFSDIKAILDNLGDKKNVETKIGGN